MDAHAHDPKAVIYNPVLFLLKGLFLQRLFLPRFSSLAMHLNSSSISSTHLSSPRFHPPRSPYDTLPSHPPLSPPSPLHPTSSSSFTRSMHLFLYLHFPILSPLPLRPPLPTWGVDNPERSGAAFQHLVFSRKARSGRPTYCKINRNALY